MTRLSALEASRPARPAAPPRILCLIPALSLSCVMALAGVSAGQAGTVLRGKVSFASSPNSKAREDGKSGPPAVADVVVYVTEKPGTPPLPGRGTRKEVELRGDGFSPRILVVTARSKLRFRNCDRVYHSLFAVTPDGRSELGSFAPGERREIRFDRPGLNHLFCQFHPAAAAFVVVCPNWFHTRADQGGDYALPPLPRGAYVVHAWHPLLGEVQRPVEVSGRDVARCDLRL